MINHQAIKDLGSWFNAIVDTALILIKDPYVTKFQPKDNRLYILDVQMTQDTKDSFLYNGRVSFRTKHEVARPDHFLEKMQFDVGKGGYSTWNTQWNQIASHISKLEVGVPYEYIMPFASYVYDCRLDVSNFDTLNQKYIMAKLQDQTTDKQLHYTYTVPDLRNIDNQYIAFLESLPRDSNGMLDKTKFRF